MAVKPAVKEEFFYHTGAKAWRANTPDELHAMYAEARKWIPAEEVLIQEIIPGGGNQQLWSCAFYRDGKARSVLLARRHRQHPREFGRAATYVETIELPAIEELSERFLRAVDYYGLVEIEFKQDPRDGQYKLLDVNARTWGFHALGRAAGVDFPYLLFADQLGERVNDTRGLPGVGWLRLVTDIPTAFSEMFRGGLRFSAYLSRFVEPASNRCSQLQIRCPRSQRSPCSLTWPTGSMCSSPRADTRAASLSLTWVGCCVAFRSEVRRGVSERYENSR